MKHHREKTSGRHSFGLILMISAFYFAPAWGAGPYVAPKNELKSVSCAHAAQRCGATQTGILAGCMWATAIAASVSTTCKDIMENQANVYSECGGGVDSGVLKYCYVSDKVGPYPQIRYGDYVGNTSYHDTTLYEAEAVCYPNALGVLGKADYIKEMEVIWGTVSRTDHNTRIVNIFLRCAHSNAREKLGHNYGENGINHVENDSVGVYYYSHNSAVGCQPGHVPNVILYDRYNHNYPLRQFKDLSALGFGCGGIKPDPSFDVKRSSLVGPQARTQLQSLNAPYIGCGRMTDQIIIGMVARFYTNQTPDDPSDDWVVGFRPVCLTVTGA